eukprot:1155652-Pelagomonas_calceolata.AAC.3
MRGGEWKRFEHSSKQTHKSLPLTPLWPFVNTCLTHSVCCCAALIFMALPSPWKPTKFVRALLEPVHGVGLLHDGMDILNAVARAWERGMTSLSTTWVIIYGKS